jgi:hypothetical protein
MAIVPTAGGNDIERLRMVSLSSLASLGRMEVFDFDLRVGMHGGHDRFLILSTNHDVVTDMNHCSALHS